MTDANSEQMLLNSKLVGCMIRGLPSSSLEQEDNKFKYANCLDREYSTELKNINQVTFKISRFGKYTHTLKFNKYVSEKKAIEKVEEYLSEPLTKEYYNRIVKDLFHESPWNKAKEDFMCRGDCLTDSKFLELVTVKNGELTFFIGS